LKDILWFRHLSGGSASQCICSPNTNQLSSKLQTADPRFLKTKHSSEFPQLLLFCQKLILIERSHSIIPHVFWVHWEK
jgi:hypothetical protein